MMDSNFQTALEFVLEWEGGWVDDPDDPGGATNQGITLATYQHYFPGTDKGELRYMSNEERDHIYRTGYWDANGISTLPSGIDLCVFDAGVMSGPSRAVMWLQELVGSAPDGIVGPRTLEAIKRDDRGVDLLAHYRNARLGFYQQLQHWWKYGNGWTKRAGAAEEAGEKLHAEPVIDTFVEVPHRERLATQFDIYAAAYVAAHGRHCPDVVELLDNAFEFARKAVGR